MNSFVSHLLTHSPQPIKYFLSKVLLNRSFDKSDGILQERERERDFSGNSDYSWLPGFRKEEIEERFVIAQRLFPCLSQLFSFSLLILINFFSHTKQHVNKSFRNIIAH